MLKHVLIALVVCFTLAKAISYNKETISSGPAQLPGVATDLVGKLRKGTVICARKPHIVWYLNEHFKEYPTFNFLAIPGQNVIEEVRKQKVDYLFISGIELGLRPELRTLLQPQNVPPDFKLIYMRRELPVLVFEIVKPADSTAVSAAPPAAKSN